MISSNALNFPYILSADIGGSHITATIYNVAKQLIVDRSIVRHDVNSQGSAIEILNCWTNALKEAVHKGNQLIEGVAVAMPGPFDYQKGISYIKGLNKYEALYGVDVKSHFANSLQLPLSAIKFRNDAESTIAGEWIAGAGRGSSRVLGVTLGTGFGSAFSDSGVTNDINLGSLPFLDSIADDYFSTRWFLKRYSELTGKQANGVKELTLLASEDKIVSDIFRKFADNLERFLSPKVQQLNPDVLIFCGNIAHAHELFIPHLSSLKKSTVIRIAELGEKAAFTGAAALFST